MGAANKGPPSAFGYLNPKPFFSGCRKFSSSWEAQPSFRPSNLPKDSLDGEQSFLKAGGPGKTAHLHALCSRARSARCAGEPIPGLKASVGVASEWPRPLERVARGPEGGAREAAGKGGERAVWVCSRPRARAWGVGGGAPVRAQGRGSPGGRGGVRLEGGRVT